MQGKQHSKDISIVEHPIFSVIIPHHNIPQLLQRCLDSIPDTPDVQVIVVDDNSSEQKVDFEHFPGQGRTHTTCIFDKEGGGAGHARNIGLRHAVGKWLVFADADDFFTADAFSIIGRHKDDLHNVILFKADSVDSDTCSPSDRHLTLNEAVDAALDGSMNIKQAILHRPVPWCKMFRRDYIQEHNIQFDETLASNDVMFVAKATCWAKEETLAVATDVLYTVTTRANSLMDNWKKDPENFLCRLEVQIRYNRFVKPYPFLRKEPVICILNKSRQFGIQTFFRAFALVLRKRALFSGFDTFMKLVNKHTLNI